MPKKKINEYEIIDNFVFMKASNTDDIIRFDLDMLEILKPYTWYVTKDKYAKANYKNKHTIQMHRLILETELFIDHIADYKNIPRTLNNTKENLRIATKSQNSMNRKIAENNTSSVVGVGWSNFRNKWRAHIKINGKFKHLGYYENFDDAVNNRKLAEQQYFNEYSYDNSQLRKTI